MSSTTSIWQPRYTLTPAIARGLMEIEAARAVVENTPLPPVVEAELRHRARVRCVACGMTDRYRQFNGNVTAIVSYEGSAGLFERLKAWSCNSLIGTVIICTWSRSACL